VDPEEERLRRARAEAAARPAAEALVLSGSKTLLLGSSSGPFSRVCVQENARLGVEGSATIVLVSDQTTVIGGRGIGPASGRPATVRIVTEDRPEIFILCDNREAPMQLDLDAPRAKVSIGITGKAGLEITGKALSTRTFAGWGLPAEFPYCDEKMDREPEPKFPPSVPIPRNCVSKYTSSNYTRRPPAGQEAELHVVGVYEGPRHVDGTVEVRVNRADRPVVLALSAYQPTIWKIVPGQQVIIREIFVSGFNPQKVEGLPDNVPLHRVKFPGMAYGWEPKHNQGGGSYLALIRAVRNTTGLVESSFQGCYAGNIFEIPCR
jgi:hypothetical protein